MPSDNLSRTSNGINMTDNTDTFIILDGIGSIGSPLLRHLAATGATVLM